MKILKLILITFIFTSVFAAHDHSARKALSESVKPAVLSSLEANESLHQAYFEYDGAKVEKAAQELKKMILSIKDAEISKLLKFSVQKLDEIKASNDRDENNKNYHLVSMALIHIVNTYDVGEKYHAYYCPMVKMKWLQNNSKDEVYNPYAAGMPHCGSKEE